MKFNIRLLAGLLLMLSTITTAQENPNSAEFHARHNTNSPYYNDGAQQYAVPQPVWADRWGAIASDGNGTYGFVTDMRSKRRAEKAAIEDCKKDGGGACSVRLAFFNQCAVVMAGSKAAATASAATKEEAVELGKKTCRENGDNACSVYWSGCSTAVRVN
ncbi:MULTISPECIES: DUF4189 domain-containing protein [Acinetobacter]|uniref:DUF4189 domain-containing protein n=1 Tax=Acinetobacter courvalinii TaxID=280147 RepID=A0AA42I506_9GAMM|nr:MULTISPECIES: DUF4189 domain-containing protein [Acinetobacter]MDH0562668.1 DUF4189 domain-containing protein [Acinetobacter courvalinii]